MFLFTSSERNTNSDNCYCPAASLTVNGMTVRQQLSCHIWLAENLFMNACTSVTVTVYHSCLSQFQSFRRAIAAAAPRLLYNKQNRFVMQWSWLSNYPYHIIYYIAYLLAMFLSILKSLNFALNSGVLSNGPSKTSVQLVYADGVIWVDTSCGCQVIYTK